MADSVGSDYTGVKVNQYTGLQQYILSLLSASPSRNPFRGFPYDGMACFLGIRKKKKTTGEYTGQVFWVHVGF